MTSRADIVVGLGFGDEGKGATVDALAARQRPGRVVRFNGGAQAAHNVRAAGRHHTFSSFGSAGLLDVPTWVAGSCAVDPPAARRERVALRHLGVDPALFVVDTALVTTSMHVAANLAREAGRGEGRHGTTGRGFGETVDYSLTHPDLAPRAKDLADVDALTGKVVALADHYATLGVLPPQPVAACALLAEELVAAAKDAFTIVVSEDLLSEIADGYTVFEGAQGFWLDECYGFQPHTTWSTTTPAGARALVRAAGVEDVRTVGCLRTYATRHGAGPFPGEGGLRYTRLRREPTYSVVRPGRLNGVDQRGDDYRPPEPDNPDTGHAGVFRTGLHDLGLLRTAVDVTMPDVLAISHTDIVELLATTEGPVQASDLAPVLVTANGPDRQDRYFTA